MLLVLARRRGRTARRMGREENTGQWKCLSRRKGRRRIAATHDGGGRRLRFGNVLPEDQAPLSEHCVELAVVDVEPGEEKLVLLARDGSLRDDRLISQEFATDREQGGKRRKRETGGRREGEGGSDWQDEKVENARSTPCSLPVLSYRLEEREPRNTCCTCC